jgi:hypothetical protein
MKSIEPALQRLLATIREGMIDVVVSSRVLSVDEIARREGSRSPIRVPTDTAWFFVAGAEDQQQRDEQARDDDPPLPFLTGHGPPDVQRIVDLGMAESVLADGAADMVGMMRALLADPFLLTEAREGREREITKCAGVYERGHKVALLEKEPELGGHINLIKRLPTRGEW